MLSTCEQKAAFFDTQTRSEWACAPYDQVEHDKIDGILGLSGLKEGMRVLEPGCGAGRLTEIIVEKIGAYGEISAVDFSEKMYSMAGQRTRHISNCRVIHATAEDYLETAQAYDMILCHNVFHHFEDKGRALASMGQSLSREGRIIIFHFLRLDQINDPNGKIHDSVMNDTIPHIADMESICVKTGLRVEDFKNDCNGYFLKIRREL